MRKGALWEAYWRETFLPLGMVKKPESSSIPSPRTVTKKKFLFFPPRNWAALGLPCEWHVAMPIIELGPCLRFCAFNVEVNGAHFHLYLYIGWFPHITSPFIYRECGVGFIHMYMTLIDLNKVWCGVLNDMGIIPCTFFHITRSTLTM